MGLTNSLNIHQWLSTLWRSKLLSPFCGSDLKMVKRRHGDELLLCLPSCHSRQIGHRGMFSPWPLGLSFDCEIYKASWVNLIYYNSTGIWNQDSSIPAQLFLSWIKAHVNIWELWAAPVVSGSEEYPAWRGEGEGQNAAWSTRVFQAFIWALFPPGSDILGSKKQK